MVHTHTTMPSHNQASASAKQHTTDRATGACFASPSLLCSPLSLVAAPRLLPPERCHADASLGEVAFLGAVVEETGVLPGMRCAARCVSQINKCQMRTTVGG
jgi:hypothetical protein